MELTTYQILIGALSALVGIVSFFLAIATRFIVKMGHDITDIKVTIAASTERSVSMERRLSLLEKR